MFIVCRIIPKKQSWANNLFQSNLNDSIVFWDFTESLNSPPPPPFPPNTTIPVPLWLSFRHYFSTLFGLDGLMVNGEAWTKQVQGVKQHAVQVEQRFVNLLHEKGVCMRIHEYSWVCMSICLHEYAWVRISINQYAIVGTSILVDECMCMGVHN